jgi:long-subunit fatty acid transport protein
MCHNYNKHFFIFILFVSLGLNVYSQTSTVSNPSSTRENDPYSRYGIGEITNSTQAGIKAMGSVSSAYSNPYSINSDNPASYADIKFTTYEAAGVGSIRSLNAVGQNYLTGSATISYFMIGIPMGKHFGMSLGFRPQSKVYYRINDTISSLGNTLIYNYSGDGGLNYAYIGLGGKTHGFSAGFNFGYMFGTTRNSTVLQIDTTESHYNTEYSRYQKVGSVYWKGGLLYEAKVKKDINLRLGATFALSQNLNATKENYYISYHYASDTTYQDTLSSKSTTSGTITLPFSLGLGAHLARTDKWDIGVDYTTTNWSQYKNFGEKDSLNTSSYKIAFGGEYTPNATARNSYLQRVTYRLGVYYGLDYVRLRNTDINYFAVTAGAGFPFKRTNDHIQTAFEYGVRGTNNNGLVKENYFKFTLGITFNDKWFVKRRYD